ncbi:MAG: TonB-dependent receptor domain-containing protein [Bacteroidota bacterium]
MKKFSLVILLVLPFFRLFAQETNEAGFTIEGSVQDAGRLALKDEVVFLYAKADSALIKTEFTDESGIFRFQQIKAGNYFICVKNPDFQRFCSEELVLDKNLGLETFTLLKNEKELKEVAVVGKKPYIERTPGKMTVNVEQSIQSTGSSAFEIIEKSPGVAVSMTDQISVNGKQGIVVQVNGKSLQMSGADLANYLRGIPSSSIEKIEFILNPSSKYDAAGSIIVDIRMKKDTRYGTNGNVNLSYGQGVYHKVNTGISLNHRTKKWNFFGNYSYADRKAFNHLELERKFYTNDTFKLAYNQDNYIKFPFKNNIFRGGFDYEIDSVSTLGLIVSGVSNKFNPNGRNVTDVYNEDYVPVSTFETENRSKDSWYSSGVNVNYRRNTDTLGSTFSMDLDYARYGNQTEQNFTTNYYDLNGAPLQTPYLLYGDLSGLLSIYSLKADRSRVFKNGSNFDFGAKTSYVEADNDIRFYDRSNSGNIYDSLKSNHFIYTENINAAYANYNFQHKKWSYQLGLRVENTNITGNQLVYQQKFDTSYIQVFPSVSVRFRANDKHSFDFNVNRRIDRPSYDQLNPFKFYLDPTTFKEGNPYLKPQTTLGLDIGHLFKDKYYTLVGIARTYNNITEIIAPSPYQQNITIQTNVNLESVDLIYANISLPFDLAKWWTLRLDLNGYLALYSGNVANTQISGNGTYNGNVNMVNNIILSKNHTLEITGNYRSREVYAFDSINRIWSVGFGYQAKILKNKGTIRVNFTDVFFSNQISADVTFTDYRESFLVTRETRVATIGFTYRFGSAQNNMRRRQGGADDLKQRVGGQGNG